MSVNSCRLERDYHSILTLGTMLTRTQMPIAGIEPTTSRLQVKCSTD